MGKSHMPTAIHRRELLAALGSAACLSAQTPSAAPIHRKGRIKQSCFTRSFARGTKMEDMLQTGARLGAVGFDMLPPAQWPELKKLGMVPTMGSGGGVSIENGIIHKE